MVEHDSDFGFRQPQRRLTIRFDGELDLARVEELNRAAASALAMHAVELIIDLTRVTFMDSTVIGWLIRTKDQLERRRSRLRVVTALDGQLVRLLTLTGLQEKINVDVERNVS
jgi:anti-sigma B factor antagonist